MGKCNRFLCWQTATRYIKIKGVEKTALGDLYEEFGNFCDKHAGELIDRARKQNSEITDIRLG